MGEFGIWEVGGEGDFSVTIRYLRMMIKTMDGKNKRVGNWFSISLRRCP